jgi:hypothetical protein
MTSLSEGTFHVEAFDILAMMSMVSFWPRSGTSGTARLWRIALSTCGKCEMASARNSGVTTGSLGRIRDCGSGRDAAAHSVAGFH